MRQQVKTLRDAASQASQLKGFSFNEFMEDWGLEDILNQAETENWPVKRIACEVLSKCCVSDGKFNNFQVGLLAVIAFLNRQLGSLEESFVSRTA
jgi:hypothetical protein